MSNQLVKIRLSNCRKVKPFWANIDDVNTAFRDLNQFISLYYHNKDHISINRNRHNLIFFHQLPAYRVPGYAVKDHNEKDKNPRYHYRGNRNSIRFRRFRAKRYPRRYVTNTKTNYWAEYDIYPIPIPKVIERDYKLNDPSGINPIKKDQIEKILIENCFGIYYSNSVNYAKMSGWDIRFHIDCLIENDTHEYLMNVSPVDILRMSYQYYKFGTKQLATEKELMRFISNSTFGWLKPILPMTMSYIETNRQIEFGKFIIRCEVDDMEYLKELTLFVNNPYGHLIDELKSFISETGIDTTTKIEITFKSDLIKNESRTKKEES